jgi:hypothetical protein
MPSDDLIRNSEGAPMAHNLRAYDHDDFNIPTA